MRLATAVVGTALSVVACGNGPTADNVGGSFTAHIDGAMTLDYEGTGKFSEGRDPRTDIRLLEVVSTGIGASVGQTLLVYGAVSIGEVSRFSVETVQDSVRNQTFNLRFIREAGGRFEAYTSQSGYVDIGRSDWDMVEGSLSIAAVQYCDLALTGAEPPPGICDPRVTDPSAPSVTISGSFRAVADTSSAVLVHRSSSIDIPRD